MMRRGRSAGLTPATSMMGVLACVLALVAMWSSPAWGADGESTDAENESPTTTVEADSDDDPPSSPDGVPVEQGSSDQAPDGAAGAGSVGADDGDAGSDGDNPVDDSEGSPPTDAAGEVGDGAPPLEGNGPSSDADADPDGDVGDTVDPALTEDQPEPNDGTSAATTDDAATDDATTHDDSTDVGETVAADEEPADRSVSVSEQTIDYTGTAIGVANTGGNSSTGSAGGVTPGSSSTDLATGSADAIGSADRTTIEQDAVTVLSGRASADITQISLVVNIGVATAASGANTLVAGGTGTSSGGSIATGNATAIGNDSSSYLTQAANAAADDGADDSASQRMVALHVNISVANSGANAITARMATTTGGSAVSQTGGASATGNLSDTTIEQIANAIGSGTANLTIDQRATVVNLGLALANSGANQVGGIVGQLMAARDAVLTNELMRILVPALAGSVGAGSAQGQIVTGDAVAIGNRSTTEVQQVATAVAAGDGTASIKQEMLIANFGVAVANTGGNAVGSGAGSPVLGQPVLAVVDRLSMHLQLVLDQIRRWADGDDTAVGTSRAVADLWGAELAIHGDLDGTSISVGSTDGARSTVRQLSAVITIGVALADSGNNRSLATSTPATGLAEAAGPQSAIVAPGARASAPLAAPIAFVEAVVPIGGFDVVLSTGDANATNVSLVVLCQRRAAETHPCLQPPQSEPSGDDEEPPTDTDRGDDEVSASAPPVQPVAPTPPGIAPVATPGEGLVRGAPPAAAVSSSGPELPATGTNVGLILLIATASFLAGWVLLVLADREAANLGGDG